MKRLALLILLAWALPARADPALFVARAPGITAYLLGSFHALKPGTEWQTPEIGTAFDAASECWFEAVMPDNPAAALTLILPGIDPERHLPALLGPADHARLERKAAAIAIPGGIGMVDTMRPWLAFMTLVAAEMKAAGLEGDTGVDTTLQAQAKAAGKPVLGFETLEQQVGFFASQPEPLMLRLMRDELHAPQAARSQLDRLVPIWLKGDLGSVAGQMNATMRAFGPAFADILLYRRNQAWADRLDGMRGSGKTILVTVGAGHLAGPGSLRDELVRRRFTIERVQPEPRAQP